MNKLRCVRNFHEYNGYPSQKLLMDSPYSYLTDFALTAIYRITRLAVWLLQKYANSRQKFGDSRLYRTLLHFEEVGEIAKGFVEYDEEEVADGIGDLLYVAYGTADCYSIPIDEVFKVIHEANMNKKKRSLTDPRMRDKGAEWKKPDILKAINDGRQNQKRLEGMELAMKLGYGADTMSAEEYKNEYKGKW